MKQILVCILMIMIIGLQADCAIFQGGVSAVGKGNQVIDRDTKAPISNARIVLPKQNYSTVTDSNGFFDIGINTTGTSVISVEKAGYKPYSLTINSNGLNNPLILEIEKKGAHNITIDTNMYHLGDNNYSEMSANAGEFRIRPTGPFYSTIFNLSDASLTRPVYLVIGSIIGIDTAMARGIGQNKITNSYASPPEVYLNGNKIAEIKINGDGQKIKLPNNLLRRKNELTIKTGVNLMQTAYIDYDDIEIMNLYIE